MAPVSDWLRTVRGRIIAWDEHLARAALERFESSASLDVSGARVRASTLDEVMRALRPEGRPLVEHHWATWCEACIPELPRIEALAARLGDAADVVGVSWDRFDTDEPSLEATTAHVADVIREHHVSWPTLVLDATPEVTFAALSLPVRTVPQTRVLDADGGVLKVYPGPLRPQDVDAIAQLLTTG